MCYGHRCVNLDFAQTASRAGYGNIAGVPSPFACLGTDDVDTGRKCFRNVLRVSDHGVVAIFVTSLLRLFSRNLVTLIAFREKCNQTDEFKRSNEVTKMAWTPTMFITWGKGPWLRPAGTRTEIVGAVLTVKAEIHYVIHDSLPFAEGTGGQFKAVEPPHIVEQLPPQVAVMAVVENEQEGVFMKQINTLGPDVRYVERHEIKPQRDAKAVVKLVMKSLIFLDGTQTRDARVRQRIAEVKAERYLMDEVAITAKKAKRRLGIDDGNTGDEENRRPGPIIFGQTGDEFDSELDV
ncbi:hypothetical protein C8J57DRAFT_1250226 [Mycena rebaudengoi]|nr:hypothetical protein C8J57DRAFT_1250226 [Mycena rebaudengoi]